MIDIKTIEKLVSEGLEGSPHYLIEMEVLPGDRIFIYIDGDDGVRIEDCVKLSRHIEGSLDREEHDFELMVSSAGLDRPMRHEKQFARAVGKEVMIKLNDGSKVEGIFHGLSEGKYSIEPVKYKGKKKSVKTFTEPIRQIPAETVKEVRLTVKI